MVDHHSTTSDCPIMPFLDGNGKWITKGNRVLHLRLRHITPKNRLLQLDHMAEMFARSSSSAIHSMSASLIGSMFKLLTYLWWTQRFQRFPNRGSALQSWGYAWGPAQFKFHSTVVGEHTTSSCVKHGHPKTFSLLEFDHLKQGCEVRNKMKAPITCVYNIYIYIFIYVTVCVHTHCFVVHLQVLLLSPILFGYLLPTAEIWTRWAHSSISTTLACWRRVGAWLGWGKILLLYSLGNHCFWG